MQRAAVNYKHNSVQLISFQFIPMRYYVGCLIRRITKVNVRHDTCFSNHPRTQVSIHIPSSHTSLLPCGHQVLPGSTTMPRAQQDHSS